MHADRRRHLAPLQRLHGGDLNRPGVVGQWWIGLDHADVADALGEELLDGLIDQRERGHREDRRACQPRDILAMAAATIVLPKPVGAWTMMRRQPSRSARSISPIRWT